MTSRSLSVAVEKVAELGRTPRLECCANRRAKPPTVRIVECSSEETSISSVHVSQGNEHAG